MNDTNIRYDAYGNKMQDKLGTNMKQTEEKPTNKRNDSYVCSCYWCQRSVSSYYYIIDKKTIPFNHKCPVPTGIIQAYGVVCIDCKVRCLLNSTFYGTISLMNRDGQIYMSEEIKNDSE